MAKTINDLWFTYLVDTLGVNKGTVNDMIYTYLGDQGYVGTIDDRMKAFLAAEGFTGDVNSAYYNYLGSLGYIGTLQDRIHAALINGDALGGAFHAFGADSYGVIKALVNGTGPVTFQRSTTKHAQDFEGLIIERLEHEISVELARRVFNLILGCSEDLTNASFAGSPRTKTATTFNFQSQYDLWYNDVSTEENRTYTFSVWLRNVSGNTQIALYHGNSATSNFTYVTTDSSSQRFSVTVSGRTGGGAVSFGVQDRNAAGQGMLECLYWQVEDVTGKANQNPSEYVSVGVGVSSELITDQTAQTWTPEGSNTVVDDGADGVLCTRVTSQNCFFPFRHDVAFPNIEFDTVLNKTYVISYEARLNSGTASIAIDGSTSYTKSLTVGQWVSDTVVMQEGGTWRLRTTSMLGVGTSVNVRNISLKEADHGLFVDGAKAFNYENGNTVTNNVVTEAKGADLTTPWGFLFEQAATNECLYSEDLSNAAWVVSNITKSSDGVQLPNGKAGTAETLTASAGNGTLLQTITLASQQNCYSVFLQRKTGTGNIDITLDNGVTWTTKALTGAGTWDRVDVTGAAAANPTVGIRIVTSGDAVQCWGNQLEAGAIPSSYIGETTSAAVTRTADDAAPMFTSTNNWDGDEGTWHLDIWWSLLNDVGSGFSIFGPRDALDTVFYYDGVVQKSSNGAGNSRVDLASALTNNQFRLVADFKLNDTLELGYRDVQGAGVFDWDATPLAYNQVFVDNGNLNVVRSLTEPIKIRDIKGYTTRKGKTWVEDNL